MKEKLMGLIRDEKGQGMTEYGLIIALVAVVAIAGLTVLGDDLKAKFNDVAGEISTDRTTTTP